MKHNKHTVTWNCDMCGKIANTSHRLPSRWEIIAKKHYCSQCKILVGKRPVILSTLAIRRCLSKFKGGLR